MSSADALEALARSDRAAPQEEIEIYESGDASSATAEFDELISEDLDEPDQLQLEAEPKAKAPINVPVAKAVKKGDAVDESEIDAKALLAKAKDGPLSQAEQVLLIHDGMKKLLSLTFGTAGQFKRRGAPEAGAYFQRIAKSMENELAKVADIMKAAKDQEKQRKDLEEMQRKVKEAEDKFKSQSKGLLGGTPSL